MPTRFILLGVFFFAAQTVCEAQQPLSPPPVSGVTPLALNPAEHASFESLWNEVKAGRRGRADLLAWLNNNPSAFMTSAPTLANASGTPAPIAGAPLGGPAPDSAAPLSAPGGSTTVAQGPGVPATSAGMLPAVTEKSESPAPTNSLAPAPERVRSAPVARKKKSVPLSSGGSYRIQNGDTLGEIASREGVSISALRQANGISAGSNLIYAGQNLVIPGRGSATTRNRRPSVNTLVSERVAVRATPASSGGGASYRVKAGENLYQISRRFRVNVNYLRYTNRLASDDLQAGQVLRIP